jgi:glycine/D-amino acid oxidase-like deaminating enzyme
MATEGLFNGLLWYGCRRTASRAKMTHPDYRSLSFWHEAVSGALEPRPPLASDLQVDVAIVGAGYTGLWTAYYLKTHAPGIRIAVVEAEIAGFGASGRNGGWCLGLIAGNEAHFRHPTRRDGAFRLQRAMFETVDEVASVCESEGIDCDYAKGGSLAVATVEAHRERLRGELEHWRALGFGEEDFRWFTPEECANRLRTRRNLGGLFTPHCAAIHPARLAQGLARAVEGRGVAIYERSPALELGPRCVITRDGSLRAETVVCATEAYSNTLPGLRRALLPMHSLMIATEPLPPRAWEEIGLAERETFSDPRRSVIYGQRTADDRIAFGARGHYFFGSQTRDRFDRAAFANVQQTLESLLPAVGAYAITHRWGGALGIPRDWRPSLGIDREAGFAWAGGYVGEGVAAANLAGRTLADLVLERASERSQLPLVGPRFPSWEPEPLRWLGVSGVRRLGASLDASELKGWPTPRLRGAIFRIFVPG